MVRMSIDFKAAQLFFALVKQNFGVLSCQNYVTELVDRLSEQITQEDTQENDLLKIAMVCRGLLLTCSYQEFSSVTWHLTTIKVLRAFVQLFNRKNTCSIDLVVAYQPKLVFIDLITQLQDLLTNMVLFSGGSQLYTELFELAIQTLQVLHRINRDYKIDRFQVEAKDFVNLPVSQTIDFKNPTRTWSKSIMSKVRNGPDTIPLPSGMQADEVSTAPFCLVSNSWLFTTDAKQRILKEHIKLEQAMNFNLWQMSEIWASRAQNRPI